MGEIKWISPDKSREIEVLPSDPGCRLLKISYNQNRPTYGDCKRLANSAVNKAFGNGISIRVAKSTYRKSGTAFVVRLSYTGMLTRFSDERIVQLFGEHFG